MLKLATHRNVPGIVKANLLNSSYLLAWNCASQPARLLFFWPQHFLCPHNIKTVKTFRFAPYLATGFTCLRKVEIVFLVVFLSGDISRSGVLSFLNCEKLMKVYQPFRSSKSREVQTCRLSLCPKLLTTDWRETRTVERTERTGAETEPGFLVGVDFSFQLMHILAIVEPKGKEALFSWVAIRLTVEQTDNLLASCTHFCLR